VSQSVDTANVVATNEAIHLAKPAKGLPTASAAKDYAQRLYDRSRSEQQLVIDRVIAPEMHKQLVALIGPAQDISGFTFEIDIKLTELLTNLGLSLLEHALAQAGWELQGQIAFENGQLTFKVKLAGPKTRGHDGPGGSL
jgi:hypothetical protein